MSTKNTKRIDTAPRARARVTPRVEFRTGRDLARECSALYAEHKRGRISDDAARVRSYVLQTAAGILRLAVVEEKVAALEERLSQVERERTKDAEKM